MKIKIILLTLAFTTLFSSKSDAIQLENEPTLIIASTKKYYVGYGPHMCLLLKKENQQNWTYFYSPIINFIYEEGSEYEVLISEKEILNPPKDASSIEYKLIEIVSKTKKKSKKFT